MNQWNFVSLQRSEVIILILEATRAGRRCSINKTLKTTNQTKMSCNLTTNAIK